MRKTSASIAKSTASGSAATALVPLEDMPLEDCVREVEELITSGSEAHEDTAEVDVHEARGERSPEDAVEAEVLEVNPIRREAA